MASYLFLYVEKLLAGRLR